MSPNNDVVGIMGLGVVGDAMRHYFEGRGTSLRLYDPGLGLGDEQSINEAGIIFVCVPTPFLPRRGFDDSALQAAIGVLTGSKTIVIKSTVLPGTTESCQARYSQHSFLFNPEFLRESSARSDVIEPDRQIIGYTAQSHHVADRIMELLPPAPYRRQLVAREAELAKYMTNALLAVKVTFANEMYDLAAALDADYDVVRQAVAADERIGPSHLDVLDGGYRGYGGKCLPKDTKALLELGDRIGVPLRLLRTADHVNATLAEQAPEMNPAPLALPEKPNEAAA